MIIPTGIYLFKVNEETPKYINDTSDFTHCSDVSIGDFEQVNTNWELTFQVVNETQFQVIDLINFCLNQGS